MSKQVKNTIEVYDDQTIISIDDGNGNGLKIIGDLYFECIEMVNRYVAYLHVTMEFEPCYSKSFFGVGGNKYQCLHGINYTVDTQGVMGCD